MTWKPVDSRQEICLPSPWNEMGQNGFHPELVERVRRFMLVEREKGTLHQYEDFLRTLGESYSLGAYDKSIFDTGMLSDLQKKGLRAVELMALEFGNLLPATLWNTLSSLIIRPNPEQEDSILNVQEHLLYPWYICDANLHALGVCFGLNFHVQSALSEHCDRVIFHGCGCNHYLGGMEEVVIRYKMPNTKRPVAAKEFLDHLLGQVSLIVESGYPFRLNDEALRSVEVVGA